MRRVASMVAACFSLCGCGNSEWPPKSLEITSDRSASSMRDCVGSPEGELLFPGLSNVFIGAPKAPPTDFIFMASDGVRIQIYSEQRERNALVVRSHKRLDESQVRFLRDCAAKK